MLQNLEIHLLATILIFTGVIKSLLPDYIAGYFQKRSPKLVFKLDKTTHKITEEAKKNGIKFKNWFYPLIYTDEDTDGHR